MISLALVVISLVHSSHAGTACQNIKSDSACQSWANNGDCKNNWASWMTINCKKACNLCSVSCVGRCDEFYNRSNPCHCNSACSSYNNCCSDYNDVCGGVCHIGDPLCGGPGPLSCIGRCDESYTSSNPCHCNSACSLYNNCCSDYNDVCGGGGGGATDGELRALTEKIWASDVNSVFSQITVNDQGHTSGADEAPLPLLTVPESALSGPTIAALLALQNNYIANVKYAEDDTPAEIVEKGNFLELIMATDIMKITDAFMHDKGLINRPLREVIDEIWFTPYSRSGKFSSTGFEHVFVGELKKDHVSGFHNWVYFQNEEKNGNLNYKGWLKSPVSLGSEGEVFMMKFDWLSEHKNIGSMWIGTSPELELAVYTVCFYARADALCPVTMNGKNFHVQTWTYDASNGKTLVGSAYPDID